MTRSRAKRYSVILTKEILTGREVDELIVMLTEVHSCGEDENKKVSGGFYSIAGTGRELT